MIITQISRQKKNENRYNIFIDDAFAFGLDGIDVYNHHLKEGMEIESDQLNTIYNTTLFSKARESALRYLTFKARTEKEIKDKLADDYNDVIIEKVIAFLKHYSYINDYEYAQKFIRDRVNLKHDGKIKVIYELRRKGIESDVITEIYNTLVEDSEIDEIDAAVALLSKKLRGKDATDRKERDKAFAALARRGYSYQTVKEAFSLLSFEDE